jgi:hypothetical protein
LSNTAAHYTWFIFCAAPRRSNVPEIESLLKRLVRGKVEFVIVGGYAAVVHGVTLLTQDDCSRSSKIYIRFIE